MKIEKINDNKIKVLIDDREAREWNISFKNISENTPEVQEMFWTAIRLAEKNVDFSVEGAKLFVEAVPGSEEDGFGMLITRVCSDAELNEAISNCSYKGKLKQTEMKFNRKKSGRKYTYRFQDFENVCVSLASGLFDGYCAFDSMPVLDRISLRDCESFLTENLGPERLALSIIESKAV